MAAQCQKAPPPCVEISESETSFPLDARCCLELIRGTKMMHSVSILHITKEAVAEEEK